MRAAIYARVMGETRTCRPASYGNIVGVVVGISRASMLMLEFLARKSVDLNSMPF